MSTFINPFTDIGFKRIFGQEVSKDLLLDFLNNLLAGERVINDLRLLDKEMLGMYEEDRSLIYDVLCETPDGERIIVEMQNQKQQYFPERTIFYAAQAIVRQGERGSLWKYDIKAVYCISFLNFRQDRISDRFRTDVTLMDMKTGRQFTGHMRLIYLQLPLFKKGFDDCENDFERWICVLKDMETLKRMPEAAKNSVFKKLEEITDLGSLTYNERMKYDRALKQFRDTYAVTEYAKKEGRDEGRAEGRAEGIAEGRAEGIAEGRAEGIAEGRAEGIAEGRAEGIAEGRAKGIAEGRAEREREIARNFKNMGVSLETIASSTGLSIEEIEKL